MFDEIGGVHPWRMVMGVAELDQGSGRHAPATVGAVGDGGGVHFLDSGQTKALTLVKMPAPYAAVGDPRRQPAFDGVGGTVRRNASPGATELFIQVGEVPPAPLAPGRRATGGTHDPMVADESRSEPQAARQDRLPGLPDAGPNEIGSVS